MQHYPFVYGSDCDRWWLDQNDTGMFIAPTDAESSAYYTSTAAYNAEGGNPDAAAKKDKLAEIIKLTKDVEEYFTEEVYPHVPDAKWFYEYDPTKKESANNKEKKGAEFPFTRFFYEYKAPESADDLLAQFMELEASLAEKIKAL